MTELTRVFEGTDIRIIDQNGNPWFVAADVCNALGIAWKGSGNSGTLSSIKDEWKKVLKYATSGGKQEIVVISEPAVYKLAFRSRKTEAERFTDWVASEVLPSIRKTGSYSIIREQTKKVRREFTDTLKSHGVDKFYHYINITRDMKKNAGIEAGKKKDDMDRVELLKIAASENLAQANILQAGAEGYEEVKPICDHSAVSVQLATACPRRIPA